MADPQQPDPEDDAFRRTLGYDETPGAAASTVVPQRSIEIEVVGGPMDGERIRITGSVVTMGRADDNDPCLGLDATVSTRHARIVRDHDSFWLEDLGSTNGTYVDEQRIHERTRIGPGTLFTIGRTCLEFSQR